MEEARRFRTREAHEAFRTFLEAWNAGKESIKSIFVQLQSMLMELDGAELDFLARPAVSYSLRAARASGGKTVLFALVDVIDDDPENRWLSVCFPAEAVSDPESIGNLIPGGIMGRDGYCFDVFEQNAALLQYLKERIREAHEMLSDKLVKIMKKG